MSPFMKNMSMTQFQSRRTKLAGIALFILLLPSSLSAVYGENLSDPASKTKLESPEPAAEPGEKQRTAPAFYRIPVFFITDRNLEHRKTGEVDFGPYRKYVGDCKHDPYMGSAYTVVPNYEGKQLDEHLKLLGWAAGGGNEKFRSFKAEPIKLDTFEAIQEKFFKEVHDEVDHTPDKNLFVFIHGYKNSFQSALGTAGRLAYYAEHPLILYSWPSAARLRAYSVDENNCEWSQEHFNDAFRKLDQMCSEDEAIKLRIFAHSMGSRILVRASPLLREKPFLSEAAMICPDVDDGLVKHYARRYLSVNGSTKIRLYMSTRDKALAISQMVHGGYNRLGEQADAIGEWITKTIAGEKAEEQAESSKAAEEEFQDRLQKTKNRMQTIDFSAIDKGLLGHNVPAALMTSMSFTDTPGAGLHFDSEQSGKRSKMSNLFTRLSKLNRLDGNSVLSGAVLKVAKDSEAQSGKKKSKELF